jgi:DsbC/DsbD-like thiol-disulfide interchange protein
MWGRPFFVDAIIYDVMLLFLSAALAAIVAGAPVETPHLKVTTGVNEKPARAGTVSLYVDVQPKPGMHVYAPGQDGYIVVALTIEKDASFKAAPPKFPVPEKIVFEPLNETQLVYSRPFRIVQEITPARKGPVTVKGRLRYQACDDKVCYRPADVPVEWSLK